MTEQEVRAVVESGGVNYAQTLLELFEAQHGREAAEPLWQVWLSAARQRWGREADTEVF